MRFINVGFNNMVSSRKIVALVGFDCAPSKRLVQEAKDTGHVVDCTGGKKTKTVIVTDSGHIILSASEPEKLAEKLNGGEEENE